MSSLHEAVHWLLERSRAALSLHRYVHALGVAASRIPLGAKALRFLLARPAVQGADYEDWIRRYDALTADDVRRIETHILGFSSVPLISVVMTTFNPKLAELRAAINSVRSQLYQNWELCIVDDASQGEEVRRLLQWFADADRRIKIGLRDTNGNISAATNDAIGMARGEFIAFLDQDDLLAKRALYEVVCELHQCPDAAIIYSDEDKIDHNGRRFEPYFKTDWNPELMLSHNMVSHLGVFRRALVLAAGGMRVGFEGSQDYDLTLRVAELTRPELIRHIPWVLYHWRQHQAARTFSSTAPERCATAAQRAVREHLERTGETVAAVERMPETPAWVKVTRGLPTPAPLVSIIIPTRDRADLLERCLWGLLNRTRYVNFEVLIVDNDSREPATLRLFEILGSDHRVRVLQRPGPFNFSALNNGAAREAKGDILVLLNNDVDVINADWLDHLIAQAVRPKVGAVGALLLYQDDRVQHAGVILGVGGTPPVAGHLYHGAARNDCGYFGHLRLPRNVSAVTAACLAVRRCAFEAVRGLDEENLAVAFNDVDLCLRLGEAGYDIVWTPHARLYHLESASRGRDTEPLAARRFAREVDYMRRRWGARLDCDPFYGPLFDRGYGDYRLAFPPARLEPWKARPVRPAPVAAAWRG
jgi:GT2 family glycosyltransferase